MRVTVILVVEGALTTSFRNISEEQELVLRHNSSK